MTPRNSARAEGRSTYDGKPCPLGHGALRRTSNGQCVECRRLDGRARYAADPQTVKRRVLTWQIENRPKLNAKTRRWAASHKASLAAKQARRTASKLQRIPKWADTPGQRAAVASVYALARRLTKETGIQHDVDHYYPLQGKNVSGFHVASNLRILTRADNLAKGNRLEEPRL